MSVSLTYETQSDFEIEMEDIRQAKRARKVLRELRDEIRQVVKYGEPTKVDDHWYGRLFKLCEEEGINGWEI